MRFFIKKYLKNLTKEFIADSPENNKIIKDFVMRSWKFINSGYLPDFFIDFQFDPSLIHSSESEKKLLKK